MKVWKYVLHAIDRQWIIIPEVAIPIHLAAQGNTICLWMEVDPNAESIKQEIFCVDTGGLDIPPNTVPLGTVIMPSRSVWHFFWYPNIGEKASPPVPHP